MNNTLKEMLDLTYEIEGLTELATRREPLPEAILPLIADKAHALHILATTLMGKMPLPSQDDITLQSSSHLDNPSPLPPHIKGASKNNGRDIRKLFNINDKFRFRRELFVNNADEFSRTLDIIMNMQSFEDAEDYFYNDLQWDPENDEVMAFMTKVQDFFEQ